MVFYGFWYGLCGKVFYGFHLFVFGVLWFLVVFCWLSVVIWAVCFFIVSMIFVCFFVRAMVFYCFLLVFGILCVVKCSMVFD
jgi:hypothetical protein